MTRPGTDWSSQTAESILRHLSREDALLIGLTFQQHARRAYELLKLYEGQEMSADAYARLCLRIAKQIKGGAGPA